MRKRTGQPTGYDVDYSERHPFMLSYHCVRHDYIYFPEDWKDIITGEVHKHGYFDEEGRFFNTVIFDDIHFRYRYKCDRCGAEEKYAAGSGNEAIKCPGCGAPMTSLIEDLTPEEFDERRRSVDKTVSRALQENN